MFYFDVPRRKSDNFAHKGKETEDDIVAILPKNKGKMNTGSALAI